MKTLKQIISLVGNAIYDFFGVGAKPLNTCAQCYKAFFRRKSLRRNFPIDLKHLQNQTKALSSVKKHLSATSRTKGW